MGLSRPARPDLEADPASAVAAGPDQLADGARVPPRVVFEGLAEGVVVVGSDGRLLAANGSAARVLRTTPDALVGTGLQDVPWQVIAADGRPLSTDDSPVGRAVRAGEGIRDELACLRWPDGTERWLRLNATPTGPPDHAVVASFRDVTEQRAAVARLRLNARLLDSVGEAVLATDRDGRLVYGNPAAAEMFGLAGDEVRGRMMGELVGRVVVGGDMDGLRRELSAERPWSGELVVRRRDGRIRRVHVSVAPYHDDEGRRLGALSVCTDVEDRRRAEEATRRRAAQQGVLVALGQRALQGGDLDELLTHAMAAVADVLGADLDELVLLDDHQQLVRRAGHGWPDGALGRPVAGADDIVVAVDADGPVILPDHPTRGSREELGIASSLLVPLEGRRGPLGALGVHSRAGRVFSGDDVHFTQAAASVVVAAIQRDGYEAELERMARHDPLTGLPNRALFLERTGEALARARRTGVPAAVLFADLDRFKIVNDSMGHDAGDRLLVLVADRLRSAVRPFDMVARLGGDEFAVLCEEVPGPQEAVALAERVQAAFGRPFELGGSDVPVTASVGVVMAGAGDDDPGSMLRDADAAMYRAKDRGRARNEVFDEDMRVEARLRLDLSRDLRRALTRDELRLVYQPSIDLREGAARSVEALLRWDHPELGAVPPNQFIGMAEESGLIVPIGAWVLEEACRQAAEWGAAGAALTVAVNLSAHHFGRPELPTTVADVLRSSGLEPHRLVLEITESAVMDDPEAAIATMDQLKALGVGLAIDDFGTGYSSLAALKRFPVDALKVDRSFVGGLGSDLQDRTIASAVVSLAHSLGLTAVAEGVETPRQLEELVALGCDSAQGFLWSRPVRPDELVTWLEGRAAVA